MKIQVQRAEYRDVVALRELYRQEANCQIIHDAALVRGRADPYIMLVEGRVAGYAGVGNTDGRRQLLEFYTLPALRAQALPLCREVLAFSQATHIEAQTNLPLMLLMLYDCAVNIITDAILFEDAFTTQHVYPNGVFRRATPDDADAVFPHSHEPVGEWVIAAQDAIIATGGFYTHYNPPYGDVFMEVAETARRQGCGTYLVQEIKRVCYEAGKRPAARTGTDNIASRRTLQKAGFLPCARLLVGEVDGANIG